MYPSQPELQVHQAENSKSLTKPSLLIVEKDRAVRELLQVCFCREYACAAVAIPEEAKAQLQSYQFHLVITEIGFPDFAGLHLCNYIHKQHPRTAVVVIASCENYEMRLAVWQHGAFFLSKPFDLPRLEAIAELAIHFGGSSGKGWTGSFSANRRNNDDSQVCLKS